MASSSDLDNDIDELLHDFEAKTQRPVLHSVLFYWSVYDWLRCMFGQKWFLVFKQKQLSSNATTTTNYTNPMTQNRYVKEIQQNTLYLTILYGFYLNCLKKMYLIPSSFLMLIQMQEFLAQFFHLLLFLVTPRFLGVQRTGQTLCGPGNAGAAAATGDGLVRWVARQTGALQMGEVGFAADVRSVGGVLDEKVTIDFAGGLQAIDLEWQCGECGFVLFCNLIVEKVFYWNLLVMLFAVGPAGWPRWSLVALDPDTCGMFSDQRPAVHDSSSACRPRIPWGHAGRLVTDRVGRWLSWSRDCLKKIWTNTL